MTADVDITVQLEPDDSQSFVESMAAAGFELRITTDVDDFVEKTRVLPFFHQETLLPLDVVLAGPGLEEVFMDRAIQVEIGGLSIPVISPEDFIVTKILAGRPKDLDDVSGVVCERLALLDLDAILATLDLVERALAQNDLKPLFLSVLDSARKGR